MRKICTYICSGPGGRSAGPAAPRDAPWTSPDLSVHPQSVRAAPLAMRAVSAEPRLSGRSGDVVSVPSAGRGARDHVERSVMPAVGDAPGATSTKPVHEQLVRRRLSLDNHADLQTWLAKAPT